MILAGMDDEVCHIFRSFIHQAFHFLMLSAKFIAVWPAAVQDRPRWFLRRLEGVHGGREGAGGHEPAREAPEDRDQPLLYRHCSGILSSALNYIILQYGVLLRLASDVVIDGNQLPANRPCCRL